MLSSRSATAVDPQEVDTAVRRLKQLLARHAVYIDIDKCAPFQFLINDDVKVNLKTVHGELLARRGGGFDGIMEVIANLRLPLNHA